MVLEAMEDGSSIDQIGLGHSLDQFPVTFRNPSTYV